MGVVDRPSNDRSCVHPLGWKTAWARLPDGDLRHTSGLHFVVTDDVNGKQAVHVEPASLEVGKI